MEQEYLRKAIRKLKKEKCLQLSYFSQKLNMSANSFYNFMSNQKNLSFEKEKKLNFIIKELTDNGI